MRKLTELRRNISGKTYQIRQFKSTTFEFVFFGLHRQIDDIFPKSWK